MNPVLVRALTYLDQFDKSNGYLIHLNRGPIKYKGSNLNFNRTKLSPIISKLNVVPKENKLSPNDDGLTIGCSKIQDHTSSMSGT